MWSTLAYSISSPLTKYSRLPFPLDANYGACPLLYSLSERAEPMSDSTGKELCSYLAKHDTVSTLHDKWYIPLHSYASIRETF